MKARFELFAGLSLLAHAAAFVGVAVRRDAPASASSTGTTPGASAAIGGDTFEVPEVEDVASQVPSEEGTTGEEAASIEIDAPPATKGALATARHSLSARASHRSAAPPPAPEPASYGALGDRSAGDLVATFKRVFPIAASSDPLWNSVPVGFYADGDVTFFLAPYGSLTDATASAAAAPAFRAAFTRTMTLLRHRLFTAQAATTHLHMVVRVTDKLVNHGAFTIDSAGSFELPSGRHVSVSITAR